MGSCKPLTFLYSNAGTMSKELQDTDQVPRIRYELTELLSKIINSVTLAPFHHPQRGPGYSVLSGPVCIMEACQHEPYELWTPRLVCFPPRSCCPGAFSFLTILQFQVCHSLFSNSEPVSELNFTMNTHTLYPDTEGYRH